MKEKLSLAEALAVALTAAVLLFTAGWFARGAATQGWFTVYAAQPEAGEPVSTLSPTYRPDSLLDLNSASVEDLMGLPGIGETRAQAIVDYRTQHGPFRYIEDITRVPGIGQSTLEGLEPYITVKEAAP